MYNTSIKAILFDMDGVVIDSEKLYSKSEQKLFDKYGINFSDSDWDYIKGCTEKEFYNLVYSKYSPTISREDLILEGRLYLKAIFSSKLEYMDGFNDIYPILSKEYKLALVTSTGLDIVNHIDKILSIRKKFDFIITSEDTKKHKPNPDPYVKAMNTLNFNSNECIVVEDSIQGIKSGKISGCNVVALEGSVDRCLLDEADYIISNLREIINIL